MTRDGYNADPEKGTATVPLGQRGKDRTRECVAIGFAQFPFLLKNYPIPKKCSKEVLASPDRTLAANPVDNCVIT